MALYQIVARVLYKTDDGWEGSIGIPTFFLDEDIQAITDTDHAERIAKKILDPLDIYEIIAVASKENPYENDGG